MSHVVKMDVQILDLEALKAACDEMGLEFRENQTTHKSYFTGETCQHAIAVKGNPNAYEIGVKVNTETGKGWTLNADEYNGGKGLVDAVGRGASKLKQAYTAQVSERNAPRGWRTAQREILANGTIRLRLTQ